MRASELFPGAIVKDKAGKIHEIKPSNIPSNWATAEIQWAEGIPLTPEILTEWFGFEMIHRSGVSEGWFKGTNPVTKDYLVYLKRIRDGTPFFFDNGHHEMKYVHQLQRLYHALTGEPLRRI